MSAPVARLPLGRALALLRAVAPSRGLVALAVAAMLAQGALGLLAPWPLQMLVDDVLGGGQGLGARLGLKGILGLALGAAVFGALAKALYGRVKTALGVETVRGLRNLLFAHLQHLSLAYHDRQRVGEMASRLGSNTYAL